MEESMPRKFSVSNRAQAATIPWRKAGQGLCRVESSDLLGSEAVPSTLETGALYTLPELCLRREITREERIKLTC